MIPDFLQRYSYLLSRDNASSRHELGVRSAVHTLRREQFTGVAVSLATGVTFYVDDAGGVEVGRYPDVWSDSRYFFIYPYRDGVEHGYASVFYLTGSICRVVEYRHGKRYGRQIDYWENGAVGALTEFQNNLLDGIYVDFFSNGQLKSVGEFKGGDHPTTSLKVGEHRRFSRAGHLLNVCVWDEGQKCGLQQKFHSNGTLREESTWVAGQKHGQFRSFFDDGVLQFQGEYRNGVAIGRHKQYAKDRSVCWLKNFDEI